MATVKVAVRAVNASRPFFNTRIKRRRRLVRLGSDPRRGVVGMVTKLLAGLGKELHLTAVAQRRQREAALARPGKWIEPGLPGDAELPLELFIVRLEIAVAERPVDNIVAGEICLGALGIAAFDFIGMQLEVAG